MLSTLSLSHGSALWCLVHNQVNTIGPLEGLSSPFSAIQPAIPCRVWAVYRHVPRTCQRDQALPLLSAIQSHLIHLYGRCQGQFNVMCPGPGILSLMPSMVLSVCPMVLPHDHILIHHRDLASVPLSWHTEALPKPLALLPWGSLLSTTQDRLPSMPYSSALWCALLINL